MASATEPLIKVKLVYPESSSHRGIGIYASRLTAALEKLSGQIKLVQEGPDLVHYPYFDLFSPSLPLFNSNPTLVTIHDLTPLVLRDLYPVGIRGKLNHVYQKMAVKRVAAVLTDSNNSSQDIRRLFSLPEHKVFVTPLGVEQIFYKKLAVRKLNSLAKRLKLPDKFVLTVAGGPNPNKNLARLAQATARLSLPLVIVGKGMLQEVPPGKIHPELKDLAILKTFDHLIMPGFVPDEDLVGLYQLASVYCQASLYEGFGLPLLEAMAAGCLIVSSNSSSLPEIYPDKTITFDPYSEAEMVTAIAKAMKLSSKARNSIIRAGKQRANDFSWERTAKETMRAYQYVYENTYRNV
jgi:glycosyltransferase involved in cell wall biosynthesis